MLDDLLNIGFQHIGYWELESDSIRVSMSRMSGESDALYAFVMNGQVKYVGKTARTLGQRLYGYAKGSGTQRTNIRVRTLILESLKSGYQVEIYGFYDGKSQQIGRFRLSTAAGLEDDIIKQLDPEWNGRGGSTGFSSLAREARELSTDSVDSLSKTTVLKTNVASKLNKVDPQFSCKIGTTYYRQGFFNVPVGFSRDFGEHGQLIQIEASGYKNAFTAKINRAVNVSTGSPRIMGGVLLRDWFQSNLAEGEFIRVTVIRPDFIKIDCK